MSFLINRKITCYLFQLIPEFPIIMIMIIKMIMIIIISVPSYSPHSHPNGHQTSFGRPMDVYMKSELHIDVHWMFKGRLLPTGTLIPLIPTLISHHSPRSFPRFIIPFPDSPFRKIGKWSEMSFFTIPVKLAVSKKSLVRMWPIRVALALAILVGLFMRGTKKFWKVKLR